MKKYEKVLTFDEIIRKNWIADLQAAGINSGPNNEPLQDLEYEAIRNLVVLEEIRREG